MAASISAKFFRSNSRTQPSLGTAATIRKQSAPKIQGVISWTLATASGLSSKNRRYGCKFFAVGATLAASKMRSSFSAATGAFVSFLQE